MSKTRSMGRKIDRNKKRGRRVWINEGLYLMMADMAKVGRVSIGVVLDQIISKGLGALHGEREREDKGQLIKVVGGLPGREREETEKAVRSVRDRLLRPSDQPPHSGGKQGA